MGAAVVDIVDDAARFDTAGTTSALAWFVPLMALVAVVVCWTGVVVFPPCVAKMVDVAATTVVILPSADLCLRFCSQMHQKKRENSKMNTKFNLLLRKS